MKSRTKTADSSIKTTIKATITATESHILSRGSFFMNRLVLCDANFCPQDFFHIPLNKKIANLMGYSPYIGEIFLARVSSYIAMQENFAIDFDNGRLGLLPARQNSIILWQNGMIKKADKILSGQYAILQCIKHDVKSGKKPLFSTELCWQIYRHKLIVNIKHNTKPVFQWQQKKIKTPDMLEKLTSGKQSLELFHQWHKDDSGELSQELVKICFNDLKRVTQKLIYENTQQDKIANSIFELANRNEAKTEDKSKLTSITIAPAFIANEVRHIMNNFSPSLMVLIKSEHNFFAPFLETIEQCYEMLEQETISLEDGVTIHLESCKAGQMIDIDMTAKPHSAHKSRSQMIFEGNKIAVNLIMQQLRLRNLGGLIFIDTVNMPSKSQRHELYLELCKKARQDYVRLQIAPLSIFQVFEIARQRYGNILLPTGSSSITIRKLDQALMSYFNLMLQAKTAHFDKILYLAPSLWKMYCDFSDHIGNILLRFHIENFTIVEAGDDIIQKNEDYKLL